MGCGTKLQGVSKRRGLKATTAGYPLGLRRPPLSLVYLRRLFSWMFTFRNTIRRSHHHNGSFFGYQVPAVFEAHFTPLRPHSTRWRLEGIAPLCTKIATDVPGLDTTKLYETLKHVYEAAFWRCIVGKPGKTFIVKCKCLITVIQMVILE